MSCVVLINPPQIFSKTQVVGGITPSLGVAYLAAVADQAGYKVKAIDAPGESPNQLIRHQGSVLRGLTFREIIKRIPRETDLIGISNLYTFAFPMVSSLAKEIKSWFPRIPIVIGGAHVSSLPEVTLTDPNIDYIVLSEGERTFLELCHAINGNRDVFDIDGFGYKKDSEIFINPKTDFIEDLDSIPFPKREMLPMENYQEIAEPHGAVRGRWTTMIATRGCPFACTFCNTPIIWQRKWRARNPVCVVNEMEELKEVYGVTDFHFEDENMSANKKWIMEFCDELINRKLDVGWQLSNGVRAETLNPEVLLKMKASGLTNLGVAPESGSRRVRTEVIHKQLNLDAVRNAVVNASKIGITITSYFIIGFPDETKAEINETIRFARELARLGLDECSINTFQLVPGCELFNKMKNNGRIKADEQFFTNLGQMGDLSGVKTWSDTLNEAQLTRLKAKAYFNFYITSFFYHPSKVLRLIRNFFSSAQETKSERVFHSLLKHNILSKI